MRQRLYRGSSHLDSDAVSLGSPVPWCCPLNGPQVMKVCSQAFDQVQPSLHRC